MATIPTQSETPQPVDTSGKAYYEEPPIKAPPGLSIGAVAWIRENLFKSVGDALITLVASTIALTTIVGLLGWAIGSANWFVIISNLRVFLVGTVPVTDLWRYEWALLAAAFVIGLTIYGYMRRVRGFGVIALLTSLLLLGAPLLIEAIVPPSSAYLAAGEGRSSAGPFKKSLKRLSASSGRRAMRSR